MGAKTPYPPQIRIVPTLDPVSLRTNAPQPTPLVTARLAPTYRGSNSTEQNRRKTNDLPMLTTCLLRHARKWSSYGRSSYCSDNVLTPCAMAIHGQHPTVVPPVFPIVPTNIGRVVCPFREAYLGHRWLPQIAAVTMVHVGCTVGVPWVHRRCPIGAPCSVDVCTAKPPSICRPRSIWCSRGATRTGTRLVRMQRHETD